MGLLTKGGVLYTSGGALWENSDCCERQCGCCCAGPPHFVQYGSGGAWSPAACEAIGGTWIPFSECDLAAQFGGVSCVEHAPLDAGGNCPAGFQFVGWYDENGDLAGPIVNGAILPCFRVRNFRNGLAGCPPPLPGGFMFLDFQIPCWEFDNPAFQPFEDDNPFL